MNRFGAILLALFVAVTTGVGFLTWRVIAGLEQEQERNHWMVAGRIFDECERRVNIFVAREEERDFGHYNYYYVPEDLLEGTAALSRSPLADRPDQPFVQGYFQYNDNTTTFNNPQVPDNVDWARRNWNFTGVSPQVSGFNDEMREWLGAPAERREEADAASKEKAPNQAVQQENPPTVVQRVAPAGQGGPTEDVDQQVYADNSAFQVRGDYRDRQSEVREQKLSPTQTFRYLNQAPANSSSFEQNLELGNRELNRRLAEVNSRKAAGGKGKLTKQPVVKKEPAAQQMPQQDAEQSGAQSAQTGQFLLIDEIVKNLDANGLLNVKARLHPFAGERLDDRRLVLLRRVEVSDFRFRQGLVVQVPEFFADLARTIIADGPLADRVHLAWTWEGDPAPAMPADLPYRYRQNLSAPFDELAVHLALPVLADQRVAGAGYALGLAALLTVALAAGFLAIYRMVGTRLEFARRRGDFVSAVTHELKTPLTSIRMYGEMLAADMVTDDERRRHYYRTITAEGERLGRLVDNVLELSKLEHGTKAVHPVVGDPREVVEEAIAMLGPHAANQGFDLELAATGEAPPVTFDRDALLQVVVNLVDNAVKFSAGAAEKRVVIGLAAEADGYRLSIRDHGPGVPAKQMRKIFEPFYRGERELTRQTKGTGIGLTLARSLIERMGGALSARNHPDGGFEVSIRLALA